MTTTFFTVFEIADLANREQIGKIVVADDGAITLSTHAESPSARRLGSAVEKLRTAPALDLRSESLIEGNFVMCIDTISAGDPLYAAALADTLSCRFGFRCVEQYEIDGDE